MLLPLNINFNSCGSLGAKHLPLIELYKHKLLTVKIPVSSPRLTLAGGSGGTKAAVPPPFLFRNRGRLSGGKTPPIISPPAFGQRGLEDEDVD